MLCNSELKQVTFLTTRTSTESKVDVFHQSQPLTQSSDVTHAVRVVKNVTCLNSLIIHVPRHMLCDKIVADVIYILINSAAICTCKPIDRFHSRDRWPQWGGETIRNI